MTPATDEDLRQAVYELQERLRQIEDHQWWANGRVRQDVVSASHIAGTALLVVFAMWAGVEFRWWYVPIAAIALIFRLGRDTTKAMEQERRRSL